MGKVRFVSTLLLAALTLLSLQFITGCNAAKGDLEVFNKDFLASDYEKCILFADKKINKRGKPRGEDLLWTLQVGATERLRWDYQKSTDYFDKCEEMLKYYDEQSEIGDAIGSTIVNDNVIPYKGEEYDGVMVNTYKALNFMFEGQPDLARVEFNRALDRQRRVKEQFNSEIRKLKAQLDKQQQKSKSNVKSNVENPKIRELLAQKYSSLYEFEAYPNFVNPFVTYLAGVFFNLVGDHSKAVDLLKESYGMVGDNAYIAEDLRITEEVLSGKDKVEDTVWLIFENGLGPEKKEFRMDLPLFVVTNRIQHVGIALPKLEFRNEAYPYLTVEVDGKSHKTCMVCDMDRIIQTEFSKDYEGILQRAIISATAKAVTQYALSEQDSSGAAIASILTGVYSFVTTSADVRIWTSLPKNFQVARFRKPSNGKLKITPPGSIPFDIDIPNCNNAVVYVRITSSEAVPDCGVMSL